MPAELATNGPIRLFLENHERLLVEDIGASIEFKRLQEKIEELREANVTDGLKAESALLQYALSRAFPSHIGLHVWPFRTDLRRKTFETVLIDKDAIDHRFPIKDSGSGEIDIRFQRLKITGSLPQAVVLFSSMFHTSSEYHDRLLDRAKWQAGLTKKPQDILWLPIDNLGRIDPVRIPFRG